MTPQSFIINFTSYLYCLSEHPLLNFLPSDSILHRVGGRLLESSTRILLYSGQLFKRRYPIGRLGDWRFDSLAEVSICDCAGQRQRNSSSEDRIRDGEEQVVPESPPHSKILQWFPMDSSIYITHIGTQLLVSIFIVHAPAIPHLQLILQTPYAPSRQKHLNLPLLLTFMPGICYTLCL